MNNNDFNISITRTEALVLRDILRHINTSNAAVVDATFQMFHSLQNRLDAPRKACTNCTSNGAPVS
ncbi:hypothetical protein UFOVP1296_72 [uncultured Caudovirales phage]|jgi:hypothetical protein|uniref:Uncharacterized protein n=1 Tax=uncultured Caudovirales phage TaxID=2100421 RepID=A0A6J5MAQ0_9CAUD|nr:hypothetical protein UFOVP471_22 [uncultured Caudovirales phage]CAB4169640.1 hypothetical protein UFOVP890_72 [uncultured Caudovirales phage]CAB4196302.1 hypothetical protein UFOVP1296_72 [uncultured Caudovirales phage]